MANIVEVSLYSSSHKAFTLCILAKTCTFSSSNKSKCCALARAVARPLTVGAGFNPRPIHVGYVADEVLVRD
jgi:hypothetical protein